MTDEEEKSILDNLKPCIVCGEQPSFYLTYNSYNTSWLTLGCRCGSKKHIEQKFIDSYDNAIRDLVKEWNEEVWNKGVD